MNRREQFIQHIRNPDTNISIRVADYLNYTRSKTQLEKLLLTKKVQNNPKLQLYIQGALNSRAILSKTGVDMPNIMLTLATDNFIEVATKRKEEYFRLMGVAKPSLENVYIEVNRAMYFQHFLGKYSQAQVIFRYLVDDYLKLFENNPEKTEKKYHSYPSSLEKKDNYWTYSCQYLGSAMYVAIASLTRFHIQNDSYKLLFELAKQGHAVAFFHLNTDKDPNSQQLIIEKMENNDYAMGKFRQAFLNNESWIDKYFVWNQNDKGEIELLAIDNATNPISFIQAVESGNLFAFEKFERQILKQHNNEDEIDEIKERLSIIKRILLLDTDIDLSTEEALQAINSPYPRSIESIPYNNRYHFQPILPKLESRMYDKITQAINERKHWKRARILLAECYKLAIGTEQSAEKALINFEIVRDMDELNDGNDSKVNRVDPCYLSNEYEVIHSLQTLKDTL